MSELEDSPAPTRLLTTEELATTLNVSRTTIRNLVNEGRIPHYRAKRLMRFNLEQVLASMHQETLKEPIRAASKPTPRRQRRTLPASDWSSPIKLD